ncbi:Gfo/Idh/MocA family oxidoreductase [Chloroflexi bacterium TSY]|nr:Gfo/Idh/MocA family oxidoreductase [Chloroflexi bacterium TSY]
MTLRVGIIGAGQAGERHAFGFAQTEKTEVTAIADLVPERVNALAARFDAEAHTDWRTMVDRGLDILVVSLPHNMHVAPAEAAAERGIHLLMEKPIATTLTDGQRILDVCQAANVKITISFVHRYREEVQLLKQWLDTGMVGVPQTVRETMNGQRGDHLPSWVYHREAAGGGVLMYSAIHAVDRIRWLMNSEVTAVTAQTRSYQADSGVESDVENGVVAMLTFANGTVASLIANAPYYRAQPARWETEIYGTTGMVRARTRQWAELSTNSESLHQETASLSEEQGPYYNFARQAQEFADAILHDREPMVTGEDGLRALEICLAIYRSAESEREEAVTLAHR